MALLLLTVGFLTLQTSHSIGGYRCEVCQDVVSTFRAQWPALGSRSLAAPITDGGADAEAVISPAAPGCNAFPKGSSLRTQCVAQRQDLGTTPETRYFVWAGRKNNRRAIEVCADLGKCRKLPLKDATGLRVPKTQEDELAIKCDQAARTARCNLDPNCPAYKASGCEDACVACLWMVRSWPQFSSVCAPKPASAPKGAGGGGDDKSSTKPGGGARFASTDRGASLEGAASLEEAYAAEAEAGGSGMEIPAEMFSDASSAVGRSLENVLEEDAAQLAASAESSHRRAIEQERRAQQQARFVQAQALAGVEEETAVEDEELATEQMEREAAAEEAAAAQQLRMMGVTAGQFLEVGEEGGPSASSGNQKQPQSKAPTGGKTPASQSAGAAGGAPPLTQSAWRAGAKPALIPKGLGSPPLSEAAKGVPLPDAESIQAECLRQYHSLSAVPEAWAAITAPQSDDRLLGSTWEPFSACRCLSKCPYNSIDALAVEDTCGGVFEERAPYLAGKRLLSALARMKQPKPSSRGLQRDTEANAGLD